MAATQDRTDAVILTALEVESNAVLAETREPQEIVTRYRRYWKALIEERRVVVWPIGAMGNVAAAVATRDAIALLDPDLVVLTGIAGGVEGDGSRLGDVVVPEQVVYYESGKIHEGFVDRRWQAFRPSHAFLNMARAEATEPWPEALTRSRPDGSGGPPSVHFGVLASGEKVIGSQAFTNDLQAMWSRTTGVEMEAVGTALAAYVAETQPDFGVVKGISDWADASKNDDWHGYAAAAAANLTARIVSRFVGRDRPLPPQLTDSPLSELASPALRAGWGPKKIDMCRRMTDAEADDLADWLEIDPHEKAKLRKEPVGFCKAIWEYLQRRKKLGRLPDGLRGIDRDDLADDIESVV